MPVIRPTVPPRGLGHALVRVAARFAVPWLSHGAMVLVTNDIGEVLLVRERLRERGRWGLPGGFLRSKEEPLDAAVRELREEASVNCSPHQLSLLMEYKQPWSNHYDHVFRMSALGDGNIGTRSFEIGDQGWFKLAELPKLTAAANEFFIRFELADGSVE